ncbi:MAG: penicillin-binding protein activator [Kordiimonas sp.]
MANTRLVEVSDIISEQEVPEQLAVTEEVDAEKITVALLLPLSGPEADIGQALLRSATMALFDAYDPRLVLLPLDTKANAEATEQAALRAREVGASVVLGPLLAANVRVAGETLAGSGIPIVGFSNDSSVAAVGRFIMGFMPELEVKRVVDYAISLGLTEHAALVPDGRYGNRVREAFGDAVSTAGATIAAIENYPPDAEAVFEPVKRLSNYDSRRKEMRDEIRFLRSLNDDVTDEIANELSKSEVLEEVSYDAVLVPEGGELLKTLGPLLPFYEIDPNKIKLLGTGLWNDNSLLREPPLQGAFFAAPDPVEPNKFLDRYAEMFGARPPRISTLAYDAMSLVAALAREEAPQNESGESLSRFSNDILLSDIGFSGLDGLFRFLPDGTVERSLAVLEVNRRGFKVVDAAPKAFPSFGYSLRQATSQE